MTDTSPTKPAPASSLGIESAPPSDDKARHPSPAVDSEPSAPETGGPKGPEPTRYGDWERKGRCIDF